MCLTNPIYKIWGNSGVRLAKKRGRKKGEGTELSPFDKKILPSITDSSIRIGVMFLRIETGPDALLALFFFIYDGLAYACSLSFYRYLSIVISNYNVISNRDQFWIQMYLLHT